MFVFISGFGHNLLSWNPLIVGLGFLHKTQLILRWQSLMSSQGASSWADSVTFLSTDYLNDQEHLRETYNSIIPFSGKSRVLWDKSEIKGTHQKENDWYSLVVSLLKCKSYGFFLEGWWEPFLFYWFLFIVWWFL